MKKKLYLMIGIPILCIMILFATGILKFHYNESKNMDNGLSPSSVQSNKSIDYSQYLQFSNISINRSKAIEGNGEVDGEVTNNYSQTLSGYFDVIFYDENGNIVKSWTSHLPDNLGSGQTKTFSVPINMYDYASYKIQLDNIDVQ